MTKNLGFVLAGVVVLVLLASTSTTGALWHSQAAVDAGSIASGTLCFKWEARKKRTYSRR